MCCNAASSLGGVRRLSEPHRRQPAPADLPLRLTSRSVPKADWSGLTIHFCKAARYRRRDRTRRRVHYRVFAFDFIVQASQRTVFSAPALVRLLARVSAAEVTESGPSPFERLSEWLRWTDAIALSNVLDAALPASTPASASALPSASTSRAPVAGDAEARLCAEARTALARAISEDSVFVFSKQSPHSHPNLPHSNLRQARAGSLDPASAAVRRSNEASASRDAASASKGDDTLEYSVVRQHYLSMQQMMEARVADLRDRLRQRLAACSVQMARLAAIDEIMERALGEREHALLSTVPGLLEAHFKRLQAAELQEAEPQEVERQAAEPKRAELQEAEIQDTRFQDAEPHKAQLNKAERHAPDGAADTVKTSKPARGAWLDVFRKDMQSALHAELAIRFQPVEALLVAFRVR